MCVCVCVCGCVCVCVYVCARARSHVYVYSTAFTETGASQLKRMYYDNYFDKHVSLRKLVNL